ncbi:lysozyme C-like [Alosa pseudoharengus]|uniref:lysozyme C-like n=1 Tax=Alosa pseudoharengus TaxID=34774 RepID=UPI003F8CCE15
MRAVVLLLLVAFASARKYEKREIAGILRRAEMDGYQGVSLAASSHFFPGMCLIEHESQYESEAKGPKNDDGSTDYGIFQINNNFWCKDPNFDGRANGCGVSCSELVRDINKSINCAKKVVKQQGIGAWMAWVSHCKGKDLSPYVLGI